MSSRSGTAIDAVTWKRLARIVWNLLEADQKEERSDRSRKGRIWLLRYDHGDDELIVSLQRDGERASHDEFGFFFYFRR